MTTQMPPKFIKQTIQKPREDGYWVGAFQFWKDDKASGVIASGLNNGKIEYLENPCNVAGPKPTVAQDDKNWNVYTVAHLSTPVAVVGMDVTQNGLMDVIVCHDFGNTMIECNEKGGHISWFENPGREKLKENEAWQQHYIGRWPAMHRLQTGYFTQRSFPELIGAPVVHGRRDKTTPVPIIRFQAPEKPQVATEWRRDVVDDQHFTVVHEIVAKRLDGPSGLDSLVVSSREGVTWLYYEGGHWKRELIGTGEQRVPGQTDQSVSPGSGDHWGTCSADVGKVGGSPFAYVATIDPFHATKVCVYTKDKHPIYGKKWKRHVLDDYGTPTQQRHWGDGPGHYITCADVDGDGNDEFLVSMFGPLDRKDDGNPTSDKEQTGKNPNKGILCYKPIDLENGIFAKWHITEESSGRCAVGDFNGSGKNDIVSISYNVKDYYQEQDPEVTLYKNGAHLPSTKNRIIGTVWGDEGMIYLPDPLQIGERHTKELIEVANIRFIVEVYPPGSQVPVNGAGIKVLYGSVAETGGELRPIVGKEEFPKKTSLETADCHLSVHEDTGAVILRLKPLCDKKHWAKTEDVPVKTLFDLNDVGLQMPELEFIKVDKLWWGGDFQGEEFYNLTGFHFRLLENKQNIAHMQFWTAGPEVNCRLHDHNDKAFKELHTCLSQGSEDPNDPPQNIGGMWAPKKKDYYKSLDEIKGLKPEDLEYCPLKYLEEHRRIWHTDHYYQTIYRKNGTVSYPGHAWVAGKGPNIDVWMALEFDARLEL